MSTYLPAFERLIGSVHAAMLEASEMVPHLKTLEPYLSVLAESDDVSQVEGMIRPVMHGVRLLWINGNHFNSSQKLLPFLKMMCNDIVKQCMKACDSATIFEA